MIVGLLCRTAHFFSGEVVAHYKLIKGKMVI